jgi:hypothetical protein
MPGMVEFDEIEFDPGVVRYASLVTRTVCLGYPKVPCGTRHRVIQMPPRACEGNEVGATCVGPVSQTAVVCRRCPCNIVNAFCLRHGAEPPVPTEKWEHSLGYFDAFLKSRHWLYTDYPYPLEFPDWLQKWPRAKQDTIMRSIDEDTIKLGRVNAMIKREVCVGLAIDVGFGAPKPKPPSKARMIQFDSNPATLAAVAPEVTCLQKALFEWAGGFTYRGINVTFASGLNSGGLADWMDSVLKRYVCPFFYECDGKNWDSCMTELHHSLRMRIYSGFSPRMAAHVDACFKCVGTAMFPDGKFKYMINGACKSGHSDTTLFNSIIRAAIAIEAMCRFGFEGEIIVAGDDLLIASSSDMSCLSTVERGFGIVPVWRQFRDPVEVSFISGCWLPSASGWMFLPKLGRLFAKLWWTCNPPSPRKMDSYRYSVITGLRAACGSVPLYDEYLRAPKAGLIALGKDFDLRAASFGGAAADAVTYEALCRKYSFTPSDMTELARFLCFLPSGPSTMKHSLIDQVMSVDLVDPIDRPLLSG